MFVGAMLLRLHVPSSTSLKEKRQVVKSLQARLSHQFGVSVAEIGELDTWQVVELGVTCVANQSRHVDQVLDSVVKYVEQTRPDLALLDERREILSAFV